MQNAFIYTAVIVGGAAVLGIEILGTRILGPFYGVSLFLWSALISVTLAALSLGYAIGGRLADRGPQLQRFAAIFLFAGLWITLIPLLKYPVLNLSEPFGLRFAVLVAATVLFFPPLALLGMVSPYAIRLKAERMDEVGRTAGNLYALSTIASVVSAVLTGFFLIPSVGVGKLTSLWGVALVITGAIGLLILRRTRLALPAIILVGAALTIAAISPDESPNPEAGLIDIRHSPYAEIRVVDHKNLRYLVIDGGTHTIVDPATAHSLFPYVDVVDLARNYYEAPGHMLLVGLGGGSVAKRYSAAGWSVDAVEIDHVVTQMAYDYFQLQPSEARMFHQDGRQFLKNHDGTYDLIILDAFGSSAIPFHLITMEAFALAKSRLTGDGLLVINTEAVGWHDQLIYAVSATLATSFEHVLVFPIQEPPSEIGNVVIMASDRKLELVEELPEVKDRFDGDYYRLHAWVNSFEPDVEGAVVFTDDLNPVDVWSERINRVARKNLHEYFANGVTW